MRLAALVTGILVVAAAISRAGDAATDFSEPGPYAAGSMSVTVTRANGSTFGATLHYPATVEGAGTPLDASGAPYPAITFGHGFVQPVSQYASTLRHLATHGFLVIASQSEGGLFPSHGGLAADMRSCLDWLELQDADDASPFFAAIDETRFGACGHSMGGGCAILATKDDARIDALATLAAADTNPSSISAIGQVMVPIRLIAGSADTIVPPATSALPMYDNADAPRQLQVIQGGFHCGFVDANFIFCDSGAITREQQLAITRRLLAEFFLLYLDGVQSTWLAAWGPGLPPASETVTSADSGSTISVDPQALSQPPGAKGTAIVTITNAGPLPTSFSLASEAAPGWSITFEPPATSVLDAGASAQSILVATASTGADAISAVISARREVDGGTRAWTAMELDPATPTPDLNGDGVVDGADLGVLLAAWGRGASLADLNEDGTVDGADLGLLLAAW